jgi:hypothetical protein
MSGKIFVSYRRADSEGYAGRLYDRLSSHFGNNNIFMDIDSIEPGDDFVKIIEDAVNSCDVLLAVLGPHWLTVKDQRGKPRLEDPEDFVRLEIATALERGIRVIPTLVQGASMPHTSSLPENLKPLSRRNAIELSASRFHADVDKMISAIERTMDAADKDKFTTERKSGKGERLGELNVEQVEDSLTEILSVETLGGIATPIIERGTPIPIRMSQIFSTAADGQGSVEIHLLRGLRSMAADNFSLGKFILDGIPPAPRGVPQIEVTFDIDANGILKVSAQDKATGRIQNITTTAKSDLKRSKAEQMRKDADKFAVEDKNRKELVEARNHADIVIYQAQKALKDYGNKVPGSMLAQLHQKIDKVLSIMANANSDIEAIKRATNELAEMQKQVWVSVANQGENGQKAKVQTRLAKDGEVSVEDILKEWFGGLGGKRDKH